MLEKGKQLQVKLTLKHVLTVQPSSVILPPFERFEGDVSFTSDLLLMQI